VFSGSFFPESLHPRPLTPPSSPCRFYGIKTCAKTPKDIPCDPTPCQNRGTCFWDTKSGSKCRCLDHYEGNYCEKETNKTQTPCPIYRYGPDCKSYCKNTDTCDGHYQCSEKGEKKCFPGWSGTNCDQHKIFDE
jgi:hypothetical protein